jgi:hypothetical protein
MSYNIFLSDGTSATVVQDGAVDNTFSQTLIGKGVQNYAEIIGQNTIHQLENFASLYPPTNPLTGQLWFNKNFSTLYVYDGLEFKALNNHISDLIADNLTSTAITADSAAIQTLTGGAATFNSAVLANLLVRDTATIINAKITTLAAGQITGSFNGKIGGTKPAEGSFTTIDADSITANVAGYMEGPIGVNHPNVARFTTVTVGRITGNHYGNLSGPVNQLGIKYPGAFSALTSDSLALARWLTAETVSASEGLYGRVRTPNQPDITSLGILANLTVAGNVSVNRLFAYDIEGPITTANQPAITQVGNLGNLVVNNTVTTDSLTANNISATLIDGTITTAQQPYITQVGKLRDLEVLNAIRGNLRGLADSARTAVTADRAKVVIGNDQPYITSLGVLTELAVSGIVDLGDVGNIKINGGAPGLYLGMDGNNQLAFLQSTSGLPNIRGKANSVLATDGTKVYWTTDPALTANHALVSSNITAANLPKGSAPFSALYTILSVDMTGLTYAELFITYRENFTNEIYAGKVSITITEMVTPAAPPQVFGQPAPVANPPYYNYVVDASGVSGGSESMIYISSSERFVAANTTSLSSVVIEVYDRDFNATTGTNNNRQVTDIKYTWLQRFSDQNVLS